MDKKYIDYVTGEKVTLEEWNRRNNERKKQNNLLQGLNIPASKVSTSSLLQPNIQRAVRDMSQPTAQPTVKATAQPITQPVEQPTIQSVIQSTLKPTEPVKPILKLPAPDKPNKTAVKPQPSGNDYSWWDKLKESTIGAAKIGYKSSDRGKEIGQAIINGDMAKAERLMREPAPQYKTEATGWIEKGVRGAFKMMGQLTNQTLDKRTQAMGLGAAGAATIAGQLGPQVLAPEEIVTAPVAYMAGIGTGNALANSEIETGFAYEELIDSGVDKNLARQIAMGVGAVNGALELVQLDELVKSYKIFEKSGVDDKVKKSFLSKLGTEIAKRVSSVAKETGQEVAQEAVTTAGSNLGRAMSGLPTDTLTEVGARLGETAGSSLLTFGFMNVPGTVMDVGRVRNATQTTTKPGRVIAPESVDTETKTFLEKVANKTGINIEVAEIYDKTGRQMSAAEGYYDRSQNKMVFAPDTSKSNIIKGVAMHELTHSIEGSKFYNEYSKFALNNKFKTQEEFDYAVKAKIQQYADNEINITPEEAQKELVAEITRNNIFDEAAINKLVSEKPNIAVQIYEHIVNALKTAKAYITGDTETLELEKARKLFEKALDSRGIVEEGKGVQYLSRKMGGYFPNVDVSTKGAAGQFGIININDKKEVINKVAAGLKATYLSTAQQSKPIKNIDTGMEIEIWKSGIKETFGNDKYYGDLTDKLKLAKIATMKDLAKLIKYGEVRNAEAGNYHNEQSTATYAYLTAPITVDKVPYTVNMDIRKSPQHGNRFYIHSLEINTASQLGQDKLPLNRLMDGSLSNPILAQGNDNVKTEMQIALEKAGVDSSIFENDEKDTRQMSIKDASAAGATTDTIEDAKREWQEKGTDSKYFKKWFGDSKIVDEYGKPLVVYHGTDADFMTFDVAKGRANMDIQGAFFSPWYVDAKGYGQNVRAFYLSIKNPASEAVAYKALNMFKGQNNAGIKARKYLESLGYDGVNNGGEEYIAFYPTQIKSATDNIGTFDASNPDIRYSIKDDISIERAKKAAIEFGTTSNFNEAGYITVEGRLLDFSGKKYGGPSNTRSMDHREIEIMYEGEAERSDALIQFMNEGNIRLLPEYGGIDISITPNSKQKGALRSYINKNQGEIVVDFSSKNGDNIGSVEYPKRTSSSKILKDIDTFFETGELPEVSDVQKFRYSIKDSEGNTLTKEQSDHFKDSKARDKDGNIKVMYHGSPESFTIFDKSKAKYSGTFGKGFYFTDSPSHATTYGNLYKVYLNIKNPVDTNVKVDGKQLKNFLNAVAENEDYSIENYGTYDVDEIYKNVNKDNLFSALRDINATAIGDMVEAVKLYNEVNGTNYDGIITDTETVVFEPNQIKRVDNKVPTENPDIRYSVKDDNQKTKRSEFYENTIKRATAIPQNVKEKLNPESFDFIPESSTEWQAQAEKNVKADMDGVIERLKNAPSISGGIEGHEAAVVAKKITDEIKTLEGDEANRLNEFLAMVASKSTEAGRALKSIDTAWDKTEPAAAVVRAHREVQKATDEMKKRNPKMFSDAEREEKSLKTRMKNAEKLTQKDKADKKLTDEQAKKLEDKRKKQMLERWVRDTVPRAKQKNMLEKIQEMYDAGAYNDEALSRLVSEKRGIPYLSLDEVKKIISYIDKANDSKEGSYEQRMAYSRAEQIIENKLPVTARDKIKAFPRISVLTGTRTQVRNIEGNIVNGGYEAARENTVGLLVDAITSKFTGERTLSGDVAGKTTAYMKGFGKGIHEWYLDIKNKVDTSPTKTRGEVKRNSRTFNSAFLNAIDEVVKKGLSLGDRPFYQGAYEARLYELGKLNENAKNKMSIEEMVADAQAYALDKVYQNDSTVKKVATRVRNVSTAIDNPFWQSVTEAGMTITVPFTETPANIFDKVLENSPIGIAKAIGELGKTKKGTFNQLEFVQNLSRGLTGTGLMAAGAMLFAKGLIAIVPYDEEYDKNKFLQSMGVQNYALKVGNKYYSLSWLEPIATPLLIGAEMLRGKDDDKNILENIYGTTKIAIDSFFEASFVQGISELFSGGSIGEGISNKLLDAHSMFTPLSAFSKSLAQWADPYVRETKDDNAIMQMLKERVAQTPFLSKTLPAKIDAFGNEMKTLDGKNNVFNVFFNPANVTEYVTTEVHDELIKVYDNTKDVNVFPDYISKPEITYDGSTVKLDDKGLEKHKKEIGRALYDEYEKLFDTDAYKNMTADEKVKAIRDAKDDIKNQANFKTIKSNGDFLSNLTQNKQVYYDKTDVKLEADYLTRWEELTPDDNKVVRDARLYSAINAAVKDFDNSGILDKDNMAKIKQYAENKCKRDVTMLDINLLSVYRATGDASVFNTNYQGLLEFTEKKIPRIINYPKTLLPELLSKSDSAVLEAYSKVMLKNDWLTMTPTEKQSALKKAKDKARKTFEEDLKKKYGARINTSSDRWQSLTPLEKSNAK